MADTPATTNVEALQQMLDYAQRQVRSADNAVRSCQRDRAQTGPMHFAYYDAEIVRESARAAYFRPWVTALEEAIDYEAPEARYAAATAREAMAD